MPNNQKQLDECAERIGEELLRQAGSGTFFESGGRYVAVVRTEDNWKTFDCDAIAKVALTKS